MKFDFDRGFAYRGKQGYIIRCDENHRLYIEHKGKRFYINNCKKIKIRKEKPCETIEIC